MSHNHEQSYWARRAEAELSRARQASDPAASKAHYELAGLYLDRAHNPGPGLQPIRPTLAVAFR